MGALAPWLGFVGGAAWIGLGFFPAECAPVTDASEVFCNRLWTPPLAAIFVASVLVFRMLRPRLGKFGWISLGAVATGFGLMAAGNGGEYWLAYQLPHQGPMGFVRGILWMGVLAGWLTTLIGSTALGVALLKDRMVSAVTGVTFVLAIPLTVGFAVIAMPTVPLGIIGLGIGLLSLAARTRG